MSPALIHQQLRGQGPIIIRTSDGKEFVAPHPEFVFVGRANLVIETDDGLLDILDPLHVVFNPAGGETRETEARVFVMSARHDHPRDHC